MVSRNYTLEKNQFECILFDEASQIILPKALSCVQRAKRMLVAGDSQQMSPSSYFAGKINSVDLLHQASYYLPNFSLKHHYRSIHSELIDFSNRHFYNNELIVYPSAIKTERPIEFHLLKNGRFINRENDSEAKELVSILIPLLKTDKRIGVVAFSEQQVSCIIKNITTNYFDSVQEKINEGTLFFKSLEQIQGDECDVLLISLAYGKDENGKFHHRFGPLNQDGGSKRLNVLFTRAKEKIHFFSSVSSSDFQLSNNEAVNLLANYMRSIEGNDDLEKNNMFPHTIDYQISNNKLFIRQVHKNISLIDDLKVFHKVMKQRSWDLEYLI
jgi:superfamily I DNA and/or RNA helicase